VRLLLDTHVLLWALAGKRLSREAKAAIQDPGNAVFVSAATLWELSIKASLGRIAMPDDLAAVLADQDIEVLPITGAHALAVGDLPPLHRDPFDRMLVAQARTEKLVLVTRDADLARYDVEVMSA
jgi:PIN domain nuclease of toxin-antitoxin system